MEPSAILAILGAVLLGAYLLESLFNKTQIPDQLFLVAAGFVFGHVFGWTQRGGLEAADRLFTEAALVVILFHGGSTLDLRALVKGLGSAALLTVLTFVGSVVTALLIGRIGFGLSWLEAALLGAILGGTAPTVIVPMVRALHIGERVSAILTVESGIADVLCIVVALALLTAHRFGHLEIGRTAGAALLELGVTILCGGGAALFWSWLRARLERHIRRDHLGTVAMLFGLVGAADHFELSGPMAALVFGLVLTNLHAIPGLRRLARPGGALDHEERYFIHELSFILKTFFFLYVGLLVRFTAWRAVLCAFIFVALQHALRPLIARLALPRSLPRREVTLVAALVPRGTVAVVLARVIAHAGLPGAAFLADVALLAVVFSIVGAALLVVLVRHLDAGSLFGRLFEAYAREPAPVVEAALAAPASASGP